MVTRKLHCLFKISCCCSVDLLYICYLFLSQALEEIIQQSADYQGSETSRSSSDTVTPDDHGDEQTSGHDEQTGRQDSTDISTCSRENESADFSPPVFEEYSCNKNSPPLEESQKGDNLNIKSCKDNRRKLELDLSSKIVNYDTDFPSLSGNNSNGDSNRHCDVVQPYDSGCSESGNIASNSVWKNGATNAMTDTVESSYTVRSEGKSIGRPSDLHSISSISTTSASVRLDCDSSNTDIMCNKNQSRLNTQTGLCGSDSVACELTTSLSVPHGVSDVDVKTSLGSRNLGKACISDDGDDEAVVQDISESELAESDDQVTHL